MLPNIASEALQARFMGLCTDLGITPRQAVLLAHIWQARAEHETHLMQDAMLSIIEFSPEGLPCKGQCPVCRVSVRPEDKAS